jgi:hypothetical protein
MSDMGYGTSQYEMEKQQLARRRKMIEALMGGGNRQFTPDRGGTAQAIAQAIGTVLAAYQNKQLDAQEKDLGQHAAADQQARLAQALSQYDSLSKGSPGVMPLTPNDDEGNPMPSSPATPPDPRGANMALLKSGIPMLQEFGTKAMLQQPKAPDSPFGKIDPKDYTPESVAKFAQSKNPADLVAYRAPEKKEGPKLGQLRTITQGKHEIQQEWTGSEWKKVGEGPRWQPPQATGDGTPKAPVGYRFKSDGQTLEPIPGGPASTGRALPPTAMNDLAAKAEIVDTTQRLVDTFKEGYGGKTILGEASNTMGRVLGDDTGQAQWWQDYQLHQNVVRNKLFGSALTPTEAKQWERAAVNPRMDEGEIKKNLARRAELERKGFERMMGGYTKGGYNVEQIEAVTGRRATGGGMGSLKQRPDGSFDYVPGGS